MKNLHICREMAGVSFHLRVPSLEIKAGETVAIVGESGCGKSTLLDVLGLVAQPNSVEEFCVSTASGQRTDLRVAGEETMATLRRQHFGYMLQSGGLLPFLTVFENVALPLRINQQRVDGARVLLEAVGLMGQAFKKPAYLSGGQRQRVALARALAHRPAIVLADEPTGAVDKVTACEIRDLLFACAKSQEITVLIVTHDELLVSGLTDRVFGFEVTRTSPTTTESRVQEDSWERRTRSRAS